jgi:mercuric ion binding protein
VAEAAWRPTTAKETAMAAKTYTVEEIHCGACEMAIRKALTRIDGVKDVEADAATNRVMVVFDDTQVDPGTVAERLTAAGYPVTG